jgi:hypothetical protein
VLTTLPHWSQVEIWVVSILSATASLASLVILKKMNKSIVWALFITITLMQMQGNMFYAFINLEDFSSWSELFNLIEEDLLYQKRILAFVSGAILPLIALGFIKSLVDYIKPEDEDEENNEITDGIFDDMPEHPIKFDKAPSKEFFEDIDTADLEMDQSDLESELWKNQAREDSLEDLQDWDVTLEDGLEDEKADEPIEMPFTEEEGSKLWQQNDFIEEDVDDPIDNDHVLDQVLNTMVEDFTEEDVKVILDANENPQPPNEKLQEAADNYSSATLVQKVDTPHLPKNEDIKSDDQLWNEAMAKKAKEEMDAFIKNKNANK